jgi:hypothetical protein
MKRLAVLPIMVLLLAGCGETAPSVDTTALQVVVKKIQDLTVKACSFMPANSSVVELIAASDPLAMTAVKLANAICAAVTKPATPTTADPALFGLFEKAAPAPCVMVNGVCVEGAFVQPGEAPAPAPE